MEKNLNAEHRERMRQKCVKFGVTNFHDHELLEMLLFYAIPRVNTNTIAHELLYTFGNLNNVLTASVNDLKTVKGIGDNAAIFINIINELIKRCNNSNISKNERYNKISKVGNYLIRLYSREIHEKFYVLMFDNSMRLISTELISEGNVNSTTLNFKIIIEKVLSRNTSAVILAHNHPNGETYPSVADIQTTQTIEKMMNIVGIRLIDHIIVAGNDYSAMFHTEKYLRSDKDTNFDFHADTVITENISDK